MDSEQTGTTVTDATLRVALGIEYVKAHGYSLTEIDLDTFDLTLADQCILGQLTGGWYDDVLYEWGMSTEDSVRCGFTCPGLDRRDPETMALQAEWHRVIATAQGCEIPPSLFPTE